MLTGTTTRRAPETGAIEGVRTRMRPWGYAVLAAVEAGMAVAAAAGAVGLVGGGIDFGEPIHSRLPLGSYPLAGVALALLVAVPMGAAAVAAWRRDREAAKWAIVAGAVLVGWIAVEVAFIRTYSWMQPVCLAWGAAVLATGWRMRS